jgi:hypothetical protein
LGRSAGPTAPGHPLPSRPLNYLGRRVIRLKRIYNFWCSMLVLHQLFCVLFTLCDIFMHFPELTYWRDATVPVPCFVLFLCFRKGTQEIFLELDKTKPEVPISPDTRRSPKKIRRGPRVTTLGGCMGGPLGAPPYGVGPLATLWHRPFAYKKPPMQKTLNQSAFSQIKFRSATAIEEQFWGIEVSIPAPCRDGEVPPEPSPSTPPPSPSTSPPSPSTLLSPVMRRE